MYLTEPSPGRPSQLREEPLATWVETGNMRWLARRKGFWKEQFTEGGCAASMIFVVLVVGFGILTLISLIKPDRPLQARRVIDACLLATLISLGFSLLMGMVCVMGSRYVNLHHDRFTFPGRRRWDHIYFKNMNSIRCTRTMDGLLRLDFKYKRDQDMSLVVSAEQSYKVLDALESTIDAQNASESAPLS